MTERAPTPIPQEGTSSNRYTILGRLSGGGMADIFLARSVNEAGLDRYVVLKRVLSERSRDPHFASMFLDEARLAAHLQHPNIAQVHDIGKLGGSYFYTMEYVHGEDVRRVMQRLQALRRAFPINLALHVACGVLAGLQHAHSRTGADGKPLGVVHRDVSPSNVMASYEGVIKVLDFGVAKATQHTTESRSGTVKGKIGYLSPEQCQGHPIDRRSDIYSFGIVLYEMLTGRRMYKRETDFATMMAIVNEVVPPPSTLREGISPALDHVVLTALAKDANARFPTATAMIEAIEEVAAREHHVLSGTAMGRFIRELFGERPEPWLELAAREEEAKAVTVTGESVADLDVLSGAVPIVSAGMSGPFQPSASVAQSEIAAQLEQAPMLMRRDDGEVAETRAPEPLPLPLPPPPITKEPRVLTHDSGPVRTPLPPSGSMPSYPTMTAEDRARLRAKEAEMSPARRPESRRWIAIAGGAVLVGVAALIGARVVGSGDDRAKRNDVVHVNAPVAAIASDAAPIAAVAPVAPIAAIVQADAGAAPATIADAFAAGDWDVTLARCAAAKLSPVDRGTCALAACNAKQRATALTFYQSLGPTAQLAIERACKDQGITLRSTAPSRPKNPCDDKRYREQNPLKCQ